MRHELSPLKLTFLVSIGHWRQCQVISLGGLTICTALLVSFFLLFNFQTILFLFSTGVCFTLVDSGHMKLLCLFVSFDLVLFLWFVNT